MTKAHEEKKTLSVDVLIHEHADRTETPLYRRTRDELLLTLSPPVFQIVGEPSRCYICLKTEEELGEPLESHHLGVERCYAEADLDWDLIKRDFPNFNWSTFNSSKPYNFVDDMTAQGLLLCKKHHTGKDEGIHNLPFSLWLMQRYLKNGSAFSPKEVIDKDEDN
jgi:hypothetical protein